MYVFWFKTKLCNLNVPTLQQGTVLTIKIFIKLVNWHSNTNNLGHISTWDVSGVTDMSYLFAGTLFDEDISNWNTEMLLI